MDGYRMSKVEHKTMGAGKEGNKYVSVLNQQQIHSDFISVDNILVFDVLQSLVNTRDETSKLTTNIPLDEDIYLSHADQGTLEKSGSVLSHREDHGHPLLDLSEQRKPVGECSASKTCHNRQEKSLDREMPAEGTKEAHGLGITEVSLNSESAEGDKGLTTINCEYSQ